MSLGPNEQWAVDNRWPKHMVQACVFGHFLGMRGVGIELATMLARKELLDYDMTVIAEYLETKAKLGE